jgi:hypothetical protein
MRISQSFKLHSMIHEMMKLPFIPFSPATSYFIPSSSEYSLSTLLLNILILCTSNNDSDHVLHPFTKTVKITVLSLDSWIGNAKTKDSELSDNNHNPNLFCT